jgi:hypothetical protein
VSHYAHSGMFRDTYKWHYSNYWPVSNKRLEDRPANNKLARAEVHLLSLVKKSYKPVGNPISIMANFEAPKTSIYTKPCKYNKLEYKIETSILQMEFYLRVREMVCRPKDAIISIFGGGKVICVGVANSTLEFISFY